MAEVYYQLFDVEALRLYELKEGKKKETTEIQRKRKLITKARTEGQEVEEVKIRCRVLLILVLKLKLLPHSLH